MTEIFDVNPILLSNCIVTDFGTVIACMLISESESYRTIVSYVGIVMVDLLTLYIDRYLYKCKISTILLW